jgi:hypothetical protein
MKSGSCTMCHALQILPVLETSPDRCGANRLLRKSERIGLTTNPPPTALSTARDQKLISIMTGAALDCGPQPGRTSPVLGWSVLAVKPSGKGRSTGWSRDWTSDATTPKRHFLRSCTKFKKI